MALRGAIMEESKAYGFALVIWGTGSMAAAQRGKPGRAEAAAYIGGALVGMALLIAVSFGGAPATWRPPPRRRYATGAIHLVSVSTSVAAGWGVATAVSPVWLAFALAGGAATILYQLLLAVEVVVTTKAEQ
jgi:hypothetical protein